MNVEQKTMSCSCDFLFVLVGGLFLFPFILIFFIEILTYEAYTKKKVFDPSSNKTHDSLFRSGMAIISVIIHVGLLTYLFDNLI
jgi:hypothetical protein